MGGVVGRIMRISSLFKEHEVKFHVRAGWVWHSFYSVGLAFRGCYWYPKCFRSSLIMSTKAGWIGAAFRVGRFSTTSWSSSLLNNPFCLRFWAFFLIGNIVLMTDPIRSAVSTCWNAEWCTDQPCSVSWKEKYFLKFFHIRKHRISFASCPKAKNWSTGTCPIFLFIKSSSGLNSKNDLLLFSNLRPLLVILRSSETFHKITANSRNESS